MDVPHVKAKLNCAELIGRPYRNGARGPAAFDCWGLCMHIAEKTGTPLPDLNVPDDPQARAELIQQQRGRFRPLRRAVAGCLVLFRIIGDRNVVKWHIGTVLPDRQHFIHTTGKLGVHIASLNRQPWKLFLEGFYIYRP